MRRLNDIKKVADFIVSSFKPSDFKVTVSSDKCIDVIVPYLPSNIVSRVSSDIHIGVFPYSDKAVFVNVYKL